MKLYFCPAYSGFVYRDLSHIMFNEKIVNSEGLVDLLALHAGLSKVKKSTSERLIEYYKAVSEYIKNNPNNILAKSFQIDPISVSLECLKWRDTLCSAGWSKNSRNVGKRIEVLSGIEEYFSGASISENITELIDAVKCGCNLPENLEIETPFDWKIFPPLEVMLLEELQKRGVKISVFDYKEKPRNNLSRVVGIFEGNNGKIENLEKIENDDSFKILKFENQDNALRFISYTSEDYDLLLNTDNKLLDNWLFHQGKPRGGSEDNGLLPITQILPLGLGILKNPLDIKNLINYLNVPLSPLPSFFRARLSEKICYFDGYYNDDVRKIISDFSDRDEKNKTLAAKFLPSAETPEALDTTGIEKQIEKEKIISFVENLKKWTSEEIARSENRLSENEIAQIEIVNADCRILILMLETLSEKSLTFTKLMSIFGAIKTASNIEINKAESGCVPVINNPGKIIGNVGNFLWCDFYNEEKENLTYSFLRKDEKDVLEKELNFWSEENERAYNKKIKLLPFLLSDKVCVVVSERIGHEKTEKHSLLIQLEKQVSEGLDAVTISPNEEEIYANIISDAKLFVNASDPEKTGIEIQNGGKIIWPDHESYSSLDFLVQNPFDYTFKYLAGISGSGETVLPNFYTARGSAAHKVIEKLFWSDEKISGSGTPSFIREKIKNSFDNVFDEALNECGAILLAQENLSELPKYRKRVFSAVNELCDVLEKNHLHVLACEKDMSAEKLLCGEIDIKGSADMILENDSGELFVFDFKYSSNKDKYKKFLKENKSIQLELYSALTEKEKSIAKKAKAVAYVLLPDVFIISKADIQAKNAIKIIPDNNDILLKQIENSFRFRKAQISNGFIEDADNFLMSEIDYCKETDDKNLIPLNKGKYSKKEENKYSDYKFFKAKR